MPVSMAVKIKAPQIDRSFTAAICLILCFSTSHTALVRNGILLAYEFGRQTSHATSSGMQELKLPRPDRIRPGL